MVEPVEPTREGAGPPLREPFVSERASGPSLASDSPDFAAPIFDDDEPGSGAAGSGDELPGQSAAQGTARRRFPLAIPGPGLLEALVWTLGVMGLQVLANGIVMTVVVLVQAAGSDDGFIAELLRLQKFAAVQQLLKESRLAILGGTQLLFVLGVMLASRLRLGRDYSRRLALRPVPVGHLALLCTLVLPLAMLSRATYSTFHQLVWVPLLEQFGGLRGLDDMNTMELLEGMVRDVSAGSLLMMIAVAPAIAEELAFRGVIGRGLLARLGLVQGMLLTSLLFAAVHVHPVHAAGVLPLGLIMHFLYLTTRSFLAPVLFHFLNNSMAVLAGKQQAAAMEAAREGGNAEEALQQLGAAAEMVLPVYLVVAAALATGGVCWLLWTTRVHWYHPDGSEWQAGYVTAESPPSAVGATAICGELRVLPLLAAAGGLVSFLAAFVYWALQQMPAL